MYNFVNLHVHSSFSLLDGALKIPEMITKVKEHGMPAIAVTDHGRVHSFVKLAKECTKQEIKPIFGTEFYVDPGGRLNKDARWRAYHLILLAKNNEGLKNLYRLNTKAWNEGFYYKPRIDWELLSQYSNGLICLSACLKCELAGHAFWQHDPKKFWDTLEFYRELFGEDYYLEIQTNTMPEQRQYNHFLKTLSQEEDMPLVLTCDAHYLNRADHIFHQYVLCLQTGSKVTKPAMSMPTNDFFLHTPTDIYRMGEIDELEINAARNTLVIAEKCEAELVLGQSRMPGFIPVGDNNA